MSILDKIAATILPDATEEDRAKARAKALEIGTSQPWLAMVVEHHQAIERNLVAARTGPDAAARRQAFKELALVLNGHSLAEETVLYPAMTEHAQKTHAAMAYEEHSVTKIQMHRLEQLDPMSQEWVDKVEHIEGALLHHIYHEENSWLFELARSAGANSAMLTQRFAEEYQRYADNAVAEPLSEPA